MKAGREVWAFIAFLGLLAAAWAWSTAESGLCTIPIARDNTRPDTGTWCLEFWLNRYQAFFGALAAIMAALIAAAPVRRQLKEMARQSATAARPALVELARELEEELHFLKSQGNFGAPGRTLIEQFSKDFDQHRRQFRQDWVAAETQLGGSLRNIVSDLEMRTARHPDEESAVSRARVAATRAIRQSMASFSLLSMTHALRFGTRADKVDPQDEEAARTSAAAALADAELALINLEAALAAEVRNLWSRIRDLERYAPEGN